MPLYAQYGKGIMGDGFRTVVQWTVLNNAEAPAGFINGLMVSAVDYKLSAVESFQPGVLCDTGSVILIATFVSVQEGGGKVLKDSSAEPNIDNLHSLTYSENRDALFHT